MAHYGLPSLPALPCPEMKGPTPWSNWVIRGRVLAGAYPASLDDYETERILTTLLELGVNTFVCLQAEFALHTPETAWRSGQGLRPYIKDAQRILIRAREAHSTRVKQDKLDFLHLPIIDGSVTSDTALSRLADDCNMRILRGERLYIHCWGGHGRTGTLVATMLGRLYFLSCSNALRYTQAFHDSRKYPQGVRSPQTQVQVAQVRRLLPDPASLRGVAYPQPTIALTDEILRPGSAPVSPLGTQGLGPAFADLGEMEVRMQPVNQQRKEAIRAKQSLAAAAAATAQQEGGGDGGASITRGLGHRQGDLLAEALNRAFVGDSNMEATSSAPATPAPARPTSAQTPWEGALRMPAAGAGASLVRPSPTRPQAGAAAAAARQASYVEQFMQQREMPQSGAAAAASGRNTPAAPCPTTTAPNGSIGVAPSKLGGKLGSPYVVNMTASSGASAAGAAALPFEEDGDISGPLRPSKVTVTIPSSPGLGKAEPAAPASGAGNRMGNVMGFLNSKFR